MTKCQIKFFPYAKTSNVKPDRLVMNYKSSEILQVELSNYLDSIRHLPIALFKYKKEQAHKLVRSKWSLIETDNQ
jgi:hypothetical protein